MIKHTTLVTTVLLAVVPAFAQEKEPTLEVALLPAVASIQPGQPFEVALKFALQDEYHIYWRNSGESGMPPRVMWELPQGFSAGPLQYPAPERKVAEGDITTFVLSGEPVLLTTITPPAQLEHGGTVKLSAKLQVLSCKKKCWMLKREVRAELPVKSATPAPANAEFIEDARRQMPVEPDQARYVKIAAFSSVDRIRPQDTFELAIVLDVQPKFHIQSNTPLVESLVATDVFADVVDGVYLDMARFPKHKVRSGPGGMKLAEFEGRVVIRIAGEADNTLPAGPLEFSGVTRFQACNEQGRCYPPQNIVWSVSVPTAAEGDPVTPTHGEIFGTAQGAAGHAPAEDEPDPSETATETVRSDPIELPSDEDSAGQPPVVPTVPVATTPPAALAVGTSFSTLAWYMLLAALGGMILNVMPCVLPVISLKLMSFVQQAGEDRSRVLKLGLAFSAGIVASFLMLASAVAVLKSQGQNVGWGFQLSSAPFVVGLAAVIFLFGLSLFGVFEIHLPGRVSAKLGQAEAREGLFGTFMKGVLATILGTPCVGPFLGTTLGWALSQSEQVIFAVFTAMGIGMALPYIVLAAYPAWMRYLPKPGTWMIRFKQFMGFVLMATVAWFLIILGDLIGPKGLGWTMVFFCFLGFAAWLVGIISFSMSRSRQLALWGSALATIAFGWIFTYHLHNKSLHRDFVFSQDWQGGLVFCPFAICELEGQWDDIDPEVDTIPWRKWERGIGPSLADHGFTVYIDYTASWCASCQVNKKAVLETPEIRHLMKELNVVPIKADFTNQPDDMLTEMRRYGRQAVPYNVIFPALDPEGHIDLPEILTQSLVISGLERAGASIAGQLAANP